PLTARDVQLLAAEGVTHVLDLREEHEWSPPKAGREALQAMERFGMKRLNVPVEDATAPSTADLNAACRFIDEALQDPEARVFVHCRGGRERTAAVLVCHYARRHGVPWNEALAALRKGRPELRLLRDQERAVREWLRADH